MLSQHIYTNNGCAHDENGKRKERTKNKKKKN